VNADTEPQAVPGQPRLTNERSRTCSVKVNKHLGKDDRIARWADIRNWCNPHGASFRRKSSPVRDVMEFRAVAMLKCGRAGSGQLVGLTAIASIEIRASGIGRATLGDDRAGFGSAENARV
jgi:hypothetical protein